jgi:hypothetical protein
LIIHVKYLADAPGLHGGDCLLERGDHRLLPQHESQVLLVLSVLGGSFVCLGVCLFGVVERAHENPIIDPKSIESIDRLSDVARPVSIDRLLILYQIDPSHIKTHRHTRTYRRVEGAALDLPLGLKDLFCDVWGNGRRQNQSAKIHQRHNAPRHLSLSGLALTLP